MADRSLSSSEHDLSPARRSLLERVRARVRAVNRALQRRDKENEGLGDRTAPASANGELRALNVVYHTLGRTHKTYREKTGEHISPDLQAAARAFKKDPSVLSLLPIAVVLDDLRLLKW